MDDILIFSRSLLNKGDAYNMATGKFTVPLRGLYTFSAAMCTESDSYAVVNFEADGSRIGAFDVGDKDYYKCSGGTATAVLEQGVQVWLKLKRVSGKKFKNQELSNFNYFTGYLIHQ